MIARTATRFCLALIVVLSMALALLRPHLEADTLGLVDGVRVAKQCLQEHRRPCPGVTAYSLQQTLIAAAAVWNGASSVDTARLLSAVSGLAVGLMAALAWSLPVTHRALWLGVVAAGPLLFYAASSFGEALAAVSLAAFVAAITRDHRPGRGRVVLICLTAAWAGLGKDTMPLVVGLLGLAAVGLETRRPRGALPRLAATGVGVLVAAAAFAVFHWFRLEALYNAEYVDHPEFFLSTPIDVVSAFAGHWFSPSAGVLWFWPVAFVVLIASGRHGGVILTVIGLYSAGLSRWWAPYGWIAWGDRLLYPAVAAGVFACLALRPERPRVPWWIWVASGAAALAALAVALDSSALAVFFAPDAAFPGPPTIQADATLYRAFLRHLTWSRTLRLDLVFAGLTTPAGAIAAALVVSAIAVAARGASTAQIVTRR